MTHARNFIAGEITSPLTAPLHLYFLSKESEKRKADDPKYCLLTEIKSRPISETPVTPNEKDQAIFDES